MPEDKLYYLAIDIGASGGRHILGHVEGDRLILEEVHRFANGPVRRGESLTWDTQRLLNEIIAGIKKCCALERIPGYIGIDTWGVDYVLTDKDGKILDPVFAYRDSRTVPFMDTKIPITELYKVTGIARQPFNTIYQLLADKAAGRLDKAAKLFFLPEYFSHCLTGDFSGKANSEYTIASTSGLLDAEKRNWAFPFIEALDIPSHLFDSPWEPPYSIGSLNKALAKETGCNAEIVMIASHDTSSAVSIVDEDALYISSGTWSLLGIQSAPILTEAARLAGYTNEGALNGKIRFLKNIMGLWMLQQTRRELADSGTTLSFVELEALALQISREVDAKQFQPIDVNIPQFLSPPSMIDEIKKEHSRMGLRVPQSPGEMAYCIYISLASNYKKAIEDLEAIMGKQYPGLSIIGGGSKAGYLNALTAEYTGKNVCAGPAEAMAIGNLLLQIKYAGGERPACFSDTLVKL